MTGTRTATTQKTNRDLGALAALVALATTLALAALMALMALGASADKAEAGTAAVTKTFSNVAQIKMPSGAVAGDCSAGPTQGAAVPYPSRIPLSLSNGFPQGSRVLDVNLTLKNYTHTFPDDVDVLLVHGTKSRTVLSDVGGLYDVNNVNLTLDDESPTSLLPFDNSQMVSGTFKPLNKSGQDNDLFPSPAPNPHDGTQYLTGFDGMKANGDWQLYVQDDAGGDCGTIAGGFSLTIKAR